jgi:hypothetical protein
MSNYSRFHQKLVSGVPQPAIKIGAPPPPGKITPEKGPPKKLTPAEEFDKVKEQEEKTFAKEMSDTNRRDQASLEKLKKGVGISNIKLQEKIAAALEAVKNNADFDADGLASGRKPTADESEFNRVKQARDKRIEDVRRSVVTRLKSAYLIIQKRALAANDIETAKAVEATLLTAERYSIIGRWREQQGEKKIIIIKKDGTVYHEQGNAVGTWRIPSSKNYSITKGSENSWSNSTWRLSGDGRTLSQAGGTWKLIRER